MYAVIHDVESTSTHGWIPIAGRPLVARQIQWLRSVRCQGIAVQIGSSAESVALGQWLARGDAIGTNVRLVASGKPLTPREIARRAGFPDGALLIAIPADVLVGGDIGAICAHAHPTGAVIALAPHCAIADICDGTAVRVFGDEPTPTPTTREAWAIRIRSLADAFTIGLATIEGRVGRQSENGILLHAYEHERGVWLSRGAQIDPSAKLIPPVLVGMNTVIRADATIGPRVFLGDRTVVERGTRLSDAMIAPGTILGESLDLAGVAIDARGTQDLATGEYATVNESLLLAQRDKPHRTHWLGRYLALILMVIITPFWLLRRRSKFWKPDHRNANEPQSSAGRLLKALAQTFRGDRTFIGLSEWTDDYPKDESAALLWKSMAAPVGLIPIDAAIIPEGADDGTRLRARVYYIHEKKAFLDFMLVLHCVALWTRKTLRSVPEQSSPSMRAL